MEMHILINAVSVVLLFIMGSFIYQRKALDFLGSLVMIIMGIVILLSAGLRWLLIIVIFFLMSIAATYYSKDYKKRLGEFEGRRTAKNVISNGVVAFVMAAFGGYYLPFVGGFIGAIATATSDTLGSEIGILSEPRLITTFKKVPAGTDGAVSVRGTVAGIIGAAIIGISAFLLGVLPDIWIALKISIISGTVGCLMDSLLGAVFERRRYLNNEHVNLLATITGCIVGILCAL
ncbi:TIGR00297 family protein [Methanobrevibacter boviskoreani]|uniref:TIGR00297 family protein n=1 Tax=Methanobrevibacter boviskoreani TaxID=1348249 RepID=UPI0023F4BFD4|nr:TIGR00297 family protein [Methanobrevibacter boviskoreani]MDD6256270.1 TIGR00297 family protein [Methanobrevibacter boviskoreani]